ncbi:hypothetical protein Syun_007246 [Stephania yunnanensis]|uniref:NAB domain-containing protein n=1 Tax=Stephania yunnanensis TaxID=152371 RepID=A0AAP0L0R5_9MAGN
METSRDVETRRLYSWWRENHISPKHSKWLQENLADIDAKVKSMLKLIEEDGDSFARRAEMYYKKRPELVKLVGEFYQAYRALAGRYDHATGALRHAHRTMAEAFPNEVSSMLADDSLTNFSTEVVQPTAEMPHRSQSLFDSNTLHKDASALSSLQSHSTRGIGINSHEFDFEMGSKGLKQLYELLDSGENAQHHVQFAPHHVKLETWNEFKDQLQMVEDTKPSLRDTLSQDNLKFCIPLESENAHKVETNVLTSDVDKEVGQHQHRQSLERVSNLETELSDAQEMVKGLKEKAWEAETVVQLLHQDISKLEEEKEDIAFHHRQSLDTISSLENEVSQAQEEARRLSCVIVMEVAKLNSAEEQYLSLRTKNESLQNELDALAQTMVLQTEELLEKHEEVERLRIGLEEEHMQFMQAQTALQTLALQKKHSESQQEQRASALQNPDGLQRLKEIELHCQVLEEEIQKVEEENNSLKEQNSSCTMLLKSLDDEVASLNETKLKLEKEIESHIILRENLQQDMCHIKEELDQMNERHEIVIKQVESVGLKPNFLEVSVKNLQKENFKLKETCQKNKDDELVLLEVNSKNMEKLSKMGVLLENFLSHVDAKSEELNEKIKALEESYQGLKGEKANLISKKDALASKLELANENAKKVWERNGSLENSLFDANVKLDVLTEKLNCMEESSQTLNNEKHGLLSERDGLISELESIQQGLADMKALYTELEEKNSVLEKEKESKIHEVEELQMSLDREKQELTNFTQLSESKLAHLDNQIHILQEDCNSSKKTFEEEENNAAKMKLEAFILQSCIVDMGMKNKYLLGECEKHFETSKSLGRLIPKLEKECLDHQTEVKSLLSQVGKLRLGVHQLSELLSVDPVHWCEETVQEDETLLQLIIQKIKEMETSTWNSECENLQLMLENSIFLSLLGELRVYAAHLESQNSASHHELKARNDKLLTLQCEKHGMLETNEQLISILNKLHEVIEDHKAREDCLSSELLRKEDEVDTREAEALTFFGEYEYATINNLLLEQKMHELIEACDTLEAENTATTVDNKLLKAVQHDLERRNKELKSKFPPYLPLIVSLQDKVTSFESSLFSKRKLHEDDFHPKEVDELTRFVLDACCDEQSDELFLAVENGVSNLKGLHTKIEAIEKAVFEMKKLLMLEVVDANVKLEFAMEEIEELSTKSWPTQTKPVTSTTNFVEQPKDDSGNATNHLDQPKDAPEISNTLDGIFVKDIQLDQVSRCSSYDCSFDPRIMSRIGVEDPKVESWAEDFEHHDEALKPYSEDTASYLEINAVLPMPDNECFSLEFQAEKEVSVDKTEVAKGVMSENPEENKILERLDSDSQKLMGLETTFLDLKKKAEQREKVSKKSKTFDYSSLKWQLKDIEEAIKQLRDVNAILMKDAKAENAVSSQESRKVRRRSVSVQAQRWSEKIGQVQLDLKRIQFLLLKLDDESRGKASGVSERRVLLRDYLYGDRQRVHRKKAKFFACVAPSDQSD